MSSVDSIINGLNWLGLTTDPKIIYQSKNKDGHVKIAKKMIDENLAYKCFHTDEELAQKRKRKIKNLKVNGEIKKDIIKNKTEYCVRIKSPIDGQSTINDKIQGLVTVENSELDDFVILRKRWISNISSIICYR